MMTRRWAEMLLLAWGLQALPGCKCNPEEVDVPPDDCGSKPVAANVAIQANLAGIRPLGSDKQIKINGNRVPGQPACFSGEVSLLTTLSGQSNVNESHSLAYGNWKFTITALSGGDQPTLPEQTRTLAAGSSNTLRIDSNASGDMVVSWP